MSYPLLLIALLGVLPDSTSQNRPESVNTPVASKSDFVSPYLIEMYIDINEDVDLREIWRRLGVETSVPYKCSECMSETFDIETIGDESKVVALKISPGDASYHQYLIFRKAKSSTKEDWAFIGNIDSVNQPYAPPAHRIEIAEDRVWFVLREAWGRRSGMGAYGEVWYEIKEREVKRVLSYPVEGKNEPCGQNPGYSYKSILTRHGSLNGAYTVPIHLLISYNISDCQRGKDSHVLFAKEQKAYYVWNDTQKQFVLDATQSDVTEKEIGSLFSAEGPSPEEFVEYNFDQLVNIAKSDDATKKDWLKRFMNSLKDSPRKKALREAIGNN